MTDHYQDDGFKEVEPPGLLALLSLAVVIILIFFVLHWFGFWEARTFRDIWQPPIEAMPGQDQ